MKGIISCKMNKMRVIILGGWAKLSLQGVKDFIAEAMPDDPMGILDYCEKNVLFVDVAPHEWLFQRCAFTVHHGGAGTTQAAVRSGFPTIVTPFSFDQFQWADWIVDA